jgi:hypothetical protein
MSAVRRLIVLLAAGVAGVALVSGSSARVTARTDVFTGYGFEACTAPSVASLQAWQASPYRAVGIYLGGVNRACGDGNLSSAWVASVEAAGWSLMPLYVGLQAPCVSQKGLKTIAAAQASAQGTAAADDAVAKATQFGLPPGSPLTFDMEGYSTTNPTCTQTVQTFLAAWTNELHALGYLASVYGSAASTIRDAAVVSPPTDAVWIADWNGKASVFGDPYVSDALWPNHQRIHQYKGGHKETWGGVTINVDSDYVDAPVVTPYAAPPPPPPTPPGGSVGSGDNQATATWPSGSFATTAVVTLTPTTIATPPTGYATGGYAVALAVNDASSNPPTPVTTFAKAVDVHVAAQAGTGAPFLSLDGGATWQALPLLASKALPTGVPAGYVANTDGSVDVLTLEAGIVAEFPDRTPPSQPVLSGRFVNGSLRLSWPAATDNSGHVASYAVLRDGGQVLTVPAGTRQAAVKAFHPTGITVYRVEAIDAAGNTSKPSKPLVVVPSTKPAGLPRPVPRWAWTLFSFQHQHTGVRPKTPRPFPGWYWRWAAWRLAPFKVKR